MKMILPYQRFEIGFCACGCGTPVEGTRKTAQGHRSQPDFIIVTDNNCWIWGKTVHKKSGYGIKKSNYKTYYAHRYVYEKLVGLIPDELEIDHICKNRICVNPNHLEIVTHTENMRRSNATILTQESVEMIREMSSKKVRNKVIAEQFGIGITHVSNIKRNKTRK